MKIFHFSRKYIKISKKDFAILFADNVFSGAYDSLKMAGEAEYILKLGEDFKKQIRADKYEPDEAIKILKDKKKVAALIKTAKKNHEKSRAEELDASFNELKEQNRILQGKYDKAQKLATKISLLIFVASNIVAPISNLGVMHLVHKYTNIDGPSNEEKQQQKMSNKPGTLYHFGDIYIMVPKSKKQREQTMKLPSAPARNKGNKLDNVPTLSL